VRQRRQERSLSAPVAAAAALESSNE